jgi:NAD+ synthase (glutamine-hydrolysing)
LKISIAQLNPIVGDIQGNLKKITQTLSECRRESPDLVVFPELFITGYPPRDLLERPWFIRQVQTAVDTLVKASREFPETGILVGAPLPTGKDAGRGLYNSALLIHQGRILLEQHKSLLPTYDVFDEARYFDPGSDNQVVSFREETLGISICEDAWNDPQLWLRQPYSFDPIQVLAEKKATFFVNISASPFYVGKEEIRYRLIRGHARRHGVPFVFVNQVGGNDELIFDGRSFAVDGSGEPAEVLPSFAEQVLTVDMKLPGKPGNYLPQGRIESVYQGLILGIRDYLRKCGFSQAVLGLSGGIDSGIVCCLAKEALGSQNVLGISMPGPFSSRGSVEDSRELARNLGVKFEVVPITSIYSSYLESLRTHFAGKEFDIAEENIQARVRGNILMAFSNKFGYLVLSTGNKSELAVGYCTMYGDMSGGLAVISDVPKTMIYQLAEYINRESEIIPEQIIKKPPSAELKPDQRDQDTLPPYDVLDQVLDCYLDKGCSYRQIVEKGYDPKTVRWILRAVNVNEYKRRQAAPGLKVTSKAFGMGRRMPIAAKYEP